LKTLVAIPVYNEQTHLEGVLGEARRFADHILAINDGSTDATAAILARQRDIATITHHENLGYGRSIIDAFRYAGAHGYDWVITMDCDEQHDPAQIPAFLDAAARDDADIVSGSRYLCPDGVGDPPPPARRRINHTINALLQRVLGLRLTDSFCGFKAHRVTALRRLALREPGYAFPMQFWVQCARHGLRIREIPVRRIYRDASRSFGGELDDPDLRLQHYLRVFADALAASGNPARGEPCCAMAPCS